jgi:hypothetical protein
MLFVALHESGCGTRRPKPIRRACPQLARADVRAAGEGFPVLTQAV